MPEGPEVKIQVDNLQYLQNKILKNIIINNGRYKKKPIPNLNLFLKLLPLKIESIKCKGKFIYFTFYDSDIVIFNTLGMSGYWTTDNNNVKHNNIQLIFDNKLLNPVYFNDVRNFGTILIKTKTDLQNKLNKLGPDILSKTDNFNEFYKRLQKRKNNYIAILLLDQTLISGVGNYLRADAIYLSKINPLAKKDDLNYNELKTLFESVKQLAQYKYNESNKTKIKKLYRNNTFLVYNQTEGPNKEKVKSIKLKDRTFWYV